RKGGGGVFEVVDKKGGHGLESLQLLGTHQALEELEVEETGRGLIGRALQEIEVLNGERQPAHAVAQDHETKDLAARDEGNANAAATFGKFGGVAPPEHGRPRLFGSVQIERLRGGF